MLHRPPGPGHDEQPGRIPLRGRGLRNQFWRKGIVEVPWFHLDSGSMHYKIKSGIQPIAAEARMLRFSLALALVTAASAAQDPGATPTKFEFRPLKAGESTQIKVESTFELDIVTRSLQDPDAVSTRQLSFVRTLECSQTAQSEGGLLVSVATAKLQRSGTNIAPVTESSETE